MGDPVSTSTLPTSSDDPFEGLISALERTHPSTKFSVPESKGKDTDKKTTTGKATGKTPRRSTRSRSHSSGRTPRTNNRATEKRKKSPPSNGTSPPRKSKTVEPINMTTPTSHKDIQPPPHDDRPL